MDQSTFALGWSSFRESPDYFNNCANTASLVSIPNNVWGHQNSFHGNAYMGLKTFFTTNFRECIGSQLTSQLTAGVRYYVSMLVCCAFDTSFGGQGAACSTNKLGIKFTNSMYSVSNPIPINNYAHIYSTNIINDTINWTLIKDSFVADSNYKYVSIGNFFDDVNTDTLQFAPNYSQAYYFIDYICVSTDSVECEIVEDINEIDNSMNVYFENPISNKLTLNNHSNSKINFKIFNSIGILKYRSNEITGKCTTSINLENIENGIYILYIENTHEYKSFKILIIN